MGESHLGVLLFTREKGLLHALAHGAAKTRGKLRILSTGFCEIQAELYQDPVADSWKITSAEEIFYPVTLSTSLERYYILCFWGEMITRSQGYGGDSQEVFDLVSLGIKLLEGVGDQKLELLKIQVLWRYIYFLGWGPDFSQCLHCGTSMAGRQAFFSMGDHGVSCPEHRRPKDPPVVPGIPAYLEASLVLNLDESLKIGLDKAAAGELSVLGNSYWEALIGAGMRTLKVAKGLV